MRLKESGKTMRKYENVKKQNKMQVLIQLSRVVQTKTQGQVQVQVQVQGLFRTRSSDKEEMKNLFDVQNHILKALETLIVGNYDTEMYFGDVERLSSTLPNCVDTQQNDHSVANFAWPYMSDAGFAWPRSDKDNANAKQVS